MYNTKEVQRMRREIRKIQDRTPVNEWGHQYCNEDQGHIDWLEEQIDRLNHNAMVKELGYDPCDQDGPVDIGGITA